MHRRLAAALLIAGAGLLCGPGVALASNAGRPLAAVVHGSGAHVFWRGANGHLYENVQSGRRWSGPTDTGIGGLAGAPTAVAGSSGADVVFWEGTDAALWAASSTGSGWSTPTRIGMGPLGSQPTAVSWIAPGGAIQFAVFWQGTNAALWEAWYAGGIWEGPRSLGMGPLNSAPTAAALGSSIAIFWRGLGPGLSVWSGATGGGPSASFSGPTYVGMGPLGSPPTAVQLGSGEVDVFWEGTNARMWQARELGGKWSGPSEDPVAVVSPPTAVAAGGSGYDVFWIGADQDVWEAYANSSGSSLVAFETVSGWSTATLVGPLVATVPLPSPPGPVTVVTPPPSRQPRALRVRIKIFWHWKGRRTWVRRISFGPMPRATTIKVYCRGHGCPRRRWTGSPRRLRRLKRALERRAYHAGDRLTVTLAAPGWSSEQALLRIRDSHKPRLLLR